MRLVIIFCGLALVASPAFGQSGRGLMAAPSPAPMMMEIAARNGTAPVTTTKANAATAKVNKETDKKLDHQVNATQSLIQREEQKLQAQFAQLDQMRNAAIEKQNQKELERIQRMEQQIVAQYQKRVEQILVSAQAQIQATTVHVQQDGTQKMTQGQQSTARPTPAQRTQNQATSSKSTRQSSQPNQKSSSYRSWWFGRR